MESNCLICDEAFPESSTRGGGTQKSKKSPRNSSTENIRLISDSKTKFALTNSQYVILQKVLTLPAEICKAELTNGPYCRDCFTHINNVCHIMSALENLQESVQEFRKDFGAKLKNSFDGEVGSDTGHGTRGKRKNSGISAVLNGPYANTRKTILDCLKNVFRVTNSPISKYSDGSKPKHLHEIIKKMDPDGSPNTKVSADMVIRTTNGEYGDMPSSIRKSGYDRSAVVKKGQQSKKYLMAEETAESASKKWTGQKKYPCQYCKLRFYKESSLRDHLKVVHPHSEEIDRVEFTCVYCSATFDTTDELKEHESEHKDCKICPICQKEFSRSSTLNSHILTHAKKVEIKNKIVKKNLACDICSKTFYNKKCLKSHKSKIHRRKVVGKFATVNSIKKTFRPGRCKICSRIVTDLESHIKITHTEEKSTSESSKINGNNNSSDSSDLPTLEVHPKIPKYKAGPASSKFKASTTPTPIIDRDSSPPPTLIAEGCLTTDPTMDFQEVRDAAIIPIPNLKPNEKKTEEKKNNFLSAASKMVPTPPSSSSLHSSKYQFKNLLKIGDAEK